MLLAPLLLLAGGLFSLPSLIERGVASLTAGPERTADRAAIAPAKVSRLIQPGPKRGPAAPRRLQVAPPRTTHRSNLRPTGATRTTPVPVITSVRPTPTGDAGITGTPRSGSIGSASPGAPPAGGESGNGTHPAPGKPAPAAPEPPAVSVAANGTTTKVTVDGGPAPATATVSVSPAVTADVTADVAAAVDPLGVNTPAVTARAELSPEAVTATLTAPVVSTAVSLLGG